MSALHRGRSRRFSWVAVSALAVGTVVTAGGGTAAAARPAPAAPTFTAYAYANKPSTHSYRPEKNYSFNSSGGGIKVKRKSTGVYAVTFFGLGSVAAQGTVDVSPEGLAAAECPVVKWAPDSTGANLVVSVDCYTIAGAPLDTPYMVAFTSGGSTTGDVDYVWANKPSVSSYAPQAARSFNSSGGTNSINRSGVGNYELILPGPVVVGGSVKVTAYGAAPGSCQVVGWFAAAPGHHVNVVCFNGAGASADRQFTATFIAHDSLVGDGGSSGYVWGDNPTAASYTPNATYQYDTVATSATVNKLGTGQWSISFPSAGTGNTGDEQATAYGSTNAHCIVDGPAGLLGGTQSADVFCFDNSGNPVDTAYTMQWWNK